MLNHERIAKSLNAQKGLIDPGVKKYSPWIMGEGAYSDTMNEGNQYGQ